ncbi:MAG TPA: hypothetical protein VFT56_10350 [Sphingomonas sp.]|nr:hypothetical protein [Sphingomonas sp.]
MAGSLFDRLSLIRTPASTFEGVGRAVMDFGFGAFLEKFEQSFGERATKILLMLIGAAVAATTVSVIYNLAIKPLIGPIYRFFGGLDGEWTLAFSIIFVVTALSSGAGMGAFYSSIIVIRRYRRKMEAVEAVIKRAEDLSKRTIETGEANKLLFEEMAKRALNDNLITQETVDLLQSLVDTGSEKPL